MDGVPFLIKTEGPFWCPEEERWRVQHSVQIGGDCKMVSIVTDERGYVDTPAARAALYALMNAALDRAI